MRASMADIHYATAEIRRGKKKKEEDEEELEMWTNAQCDGRPAKCRWRPLFNATVWLTLVECRAVTLTRRKTR